MEADLTEPTNGRATKFAVIVYLTTIGLRNSRNSIPEVLEVCSSHGSQRIKPLKYRYNHRE
jgi:hypothetical protein